MDSHAPTRRPGRPRREDALGDTRERILDAATKEFAERGYDAVTMRDIAAAVGVNVATVHHHARSKVELYDAVFARMYARESRELDAALVRVAKQFEAGSGSVMDALHHLLDTYLEFLEENPSVTSLWLRRWLEPREHRRLDQEYALPLYGQVEDLLARAHAAGLLEEPSPRVAVRSVIWAVHAHVTAVAAGGDGVAAERREFHAFAHRLVERLWGPSAHA